MKPPKIASWILWRANRYKNQEIILGDFEEYYKDICNKVGKTKANIWYWYQVSKSIPIFIKTTIYWNFIMHKDYIRIALRNINKYKGYSFIKIIGLSIGIACFLIAFLFAKYEFSYDKFHKNIDTIFRVALYSNNNDNLSKPLTYDLGYALKEDIPEIKHWVRITGPRPLIKIGQEVFEDKILTIDNDFFKMFSFRLKNGNPYIASNTPKSIIISHQIADKYFREENAIGKTIALKVGNTFEDFFISGVLEKIPVNSSLRFNFLLPIHSVEKYKSEYRLGAVKTFIQIHDNVDMISLKNKLALVKKKIEQKQDHLKKYELTLEPFSDLHFSDISAFSAHQSKPEYSYILLTIAMAVLSLACLNFITLSIGISSKQTMEIGLRKILGSTKIQLIKQFMSEAFVITVIAFIFGSGLVKLILPQFSYIVEKELSFNLIDNIPSFLVLLGILVGTSIIIGSYPALLLSGFHPLDVIRKNIKISSNTWVPQIMVIFQFGLSICFIICTFQMSKQIYYLNNKELGFEKRQIVLVHGYKWRAQETKGNRIYRNYKESLLSDSRILNVSRFFMGSIMEESLRSLPVFKTESGEIKSHNILVGYDFINTLDMQLVMGRDFTKEDAISSKNKNNIKPIIVNESFVKKLAWDKPIGKIIGKDKYKSQIIGVFKDYHFVSFYHSIEPLILSPINYNSQYIPAYIIIKIAPNGVQKTLSLIETKFKEILPNSLFKYSFLDEDIFANYRSDNNWMKIIRISTVLSIFVSCLGLFGLIVLAVTNQTKEIGIRKVMGATATDMLIFLSRKYILLIFIANILAWPIAYYTMNKWLQNFAYRIHISFWIFVLSGLVALVIASLTISWQVIRSAKVNPVEALRYE
jgi:putative ABC transport system permease protein